MLGISCSSIQMILFTNLYMRKDAAKLVVCPLRNAVFEQNSMTSIVLSAWVHTKEGSRDFIPDFPSLELVLLPKIFFTFHIIHRNLLIHIVIHMIQQDVNQRRPGFSRLEGHTIHGVT